MIFQRAVRREFTHSAAGVFTALFAIMMTTQLIRLLNEAAQGSVEPDAVVALLGFSALYYLPVLLSLSSFVAILLTLSRSYRDSEMVVWFSSGLPLTAWIRPVLVFVMPLVLTISVLSLFLSPWALSQSAEFRGKLSSRQDAGQISPGAFQESSAGDRVVFVEGVADDTSNVRNVFVSEARDGRFGVTMAGTGHQEIAENGDRFIVLQNGRRYDFQPGTADFRILEYARYAVRLETKESRGLAPTPRTMPTLDLLPIDLPVYRAELLVPFQHAVFGGRAGLAGDSAVVRQSACRSFGEHAARHSGLPDLQQSGDHQPGLGGEREGVLCGRRAGGASVHAVPPSCPFLPTHRRLLLPTLVSMKVYRRYLAREVSAAILLVLLAFLALFAFFDLLGEIKGVGQGGYQLHHALGFVLLRAPGRAYELMPIAVLIGTLYALSTLARHSEITVLRVSGLSTAALAGRLFQVAGCLPWRPS